jgi:hypothetical protein
MNRSAPVPDNFPVGDMFIHFTGSKRSQTSAKFSAEICAADGTPVHIPILFQKKQLQAQVGTVWIFPKELPILMNLIQSNAFKYYHEIRVLCAEATVQYGTKPIHYYLSPILGSPGEVTRVPKGKHPVLACQECDHMLLRFSFNWKMIRDDPALSTCPYCGQPLVAVERPRKIVETTLDFGTKDCITRGTNNQLGLLYGGLSVHATTKVRGLLYFLQNYQNLYPNNVIGPLTTWFKQKEGRITFKNCEAQPTLEQVEWRSAILIPEDYIAF